MASIIGGALVSQAAAGAAAGVMKNIPNITIAEPKDSCNCNKAQCCFSWFSSIACCNDCCSSTTLIYDPNSNLMEPGPKPKGKSFDESEEIRQQTITGYRAWGENQFGAEPFYIGAQIADFGSGEKTKKSKKVKWLTLKDHYRLEQGVESLRQWGHPAMDLWSRIQQAQFDEGSKGKVRVADISRAMFTRKEREQIQHLFTYEGVKLLQESSQLTTDELVRLVRAAQKAKTKVMPIDEFTVEDLERVLTPASLQAIADRCLTSSMHSIEATASDISGS